MTDQVTGASPNFGLRNATEGVPYSTFSTDGRAGGVAVATSGSAWRVVCRADAAPFESVCRAAGDASFSCFGSSTSGRDRLRRADRRRHPAGPEPFSGWYKVDGARA